MSEHLQLRNISPDIEAKLQAVGIADKATLEKMGAKNAYQLLVAAGYEQDLEIYYRLCGALEDIDWQIVADREKRRQEKDIDYDT